MRIWSIVIMLSFSILACTPNKEELKDIIAKNPDIIFDTISRHSQTFIQTLKQASAKAKKISEEQLKRKRQELIDAEFKKPKRPDLHNSKNIFGVQDAKITLILYSDFECPYCQISYKLVNQIQKKYGEHLRVILKHVPMVDRHAHSLLAAKYFEAIALQNLGKAQKFYHYLFTHQRQLVKKGDIFLKAATRHVGANEKQVKKDLESKTIQRKINLDIAEAKKFGFNDSPNFLINGVSIKGASTIADLSQIIERHLKKNKK